MAHKDPAKFLAIINADIDKGIAAMREDRARNKHLSDAEFIHTIGSKFTQALRAGILDPEEMTLKAVVALYRLSTATCRRDGETCHD